ncbi:F-box protein [Cardamine amara subsp. amara]|uniref:F-box protein n=1 Tax=Cardamine amara subsp. amara TaxID=228776 RepID=A0ABD0ZRF4_CARAN
MSDLPRDLVEEVLCRVPLTSLGTVRSICKKWNTLSKDPSFGKKHIAGRQAKLTTSSEREFMVIKMIKDMVYLMSVNLHNSDFESCIKREGKLNSQWLLDDVSQVFHCKGLLLCICEHGTTLIVWNPYLGQTRLLEPRDKLHREDYTYALGYNNISKSYKILRFINCHCPAFDEPVYDEPAYVEFKIYDINTSSLRVLDITPQDWWVRAYYSCCVSLKSNTYWFATEKYLNTRETLDSFLVCFDFTSETFGPHLPLPFEFGFYSAQDLILSSVREEKLAVLIRQQDTSMIEIWITTKIEPNAVSWSSKVFLAVDVSPFACSDWPFEVRGASFFIDEEKKVAVVFVRSVAYIVGVDGTLKEVDLGGSTYPFCFPRPHLCSYVPSLMQL